MQTWYEPQYPYREGTHLLAILRDGWARGFVVEQTVEEAHVMGFTKVTPDLVMRLWRHEDRKMRRHFGLEDIRNV